MKRSFTFALLLVVCLACLGPMAAQDAPTPEPVGLRPDAPEYALHGPYWVGTRVFEVQDVHKSPFTVRAWYPALNPDGLDESYIYPRSISDVHGHALDGAAPDSSQGPYPLVILGHGFTGIGELYAYIGEHLASHGFVVFAPHHTHDAMHYVYGSVIIRLNEILDAIAYADTLRASDTEFGGLIDTDQIGVMGHSFGGLTSFGAGGAPINWNSIQAYCSEITDDPACYYNLDKERMLEEAGLEFEPGGLWPAIADSRVRAIVPISGSAEPYGSDGLAQLTIPVLVIYGSEDWLELSSDRAVVGWMHPAYDWIGSDQKIHAVFEGAGHRIFLETPWSDYDPAWDRDQAHDLTNHLVTAFLLSTLKGDAEATAALAPDAVNFPGIDYQAEGF